MATVCYESAWTFVRDVAGRGFGMLVKVISNHAKSNNTIPLILYIVPNHKLSNSWSGNTVTFGHPIPSSYDGTCCQRNVRIDKFHNFPNGTQKWEPASSFQNVGILSVMDNPHRDRVNDPETISLVWAEHRLLWDCSSHSPFGSVP